MKDNYKTIVDVVYDKNNYLVKQGLKRKDGKKKINVEELVGWDFLDINKSGQIEPFFIIPQLEKWTDKYVGYTYRKDKKIAKEVFSPPVLLLKETVDANLRSIPVISLERNILFTDKVTSIKVIGNNKPNYYNLAGLLYSSLFSYFILIKSSTVGIMIEQQVNDKEKWGFPYIDNLKIKNIVRQIEETTKKLYEEKQRPLNPKIQVLEDKKKKLIANLNDEILDSFDLDEQERALVDYAVNITIPLIMKHKGYEKELFQPLKIKDPFLTDYTGVFLNRFRNSFERSDKKFTLQILRSNYIIGMFFRVTNKPNNKEPISWEQTSDDNLLTELSSLGCQKITESLFIQKDIRGFGKDGFYIVKPNEKKLWHKAIAYLDAEEFADAMLRAGSKEKQNG